MKINKPVIINSLAFRIIMPVIVIILLSGIGLYTFVLRSVSDFTDRHIKGILSVMSRDIYNICDRNLNELVKSGLAGAEKAVRIRKGLTMGMIEDFMRENNLEGSIIREDNKEAQLTVGFPSGLSELIEKKVKENVVASLKYRGKIYYVNHIHFTPWRFHIVLIKDADEYSALTMKVRLTYGVTGLILLMTTLLSLYFLNRYIRNPMYKIIKPIQKGEKPEYKGIHEFEFLSDTIRQMMDALQKETRMLNNIYHIAASKRGEEFFAEVAKTIGRIFGLNSIIGKIDPDAENINVAAMYYEGEIKKGINITLNGTPCEGVVMKKHMAVIEKDAYKQFPLSEGLTAIKADSYIGIAIFDRKDNVIGIVNAFGKEREFTEADIKVFQTIGQMVATEFERLDYETEKEQIKEQLFQAQKMEAIGTLAGGIAHDFNNMLQGILGYASLLKMKISEDDPIYKSLSVIEHTAERSSEMTKQLLGFARKGKYVIEPLNLNHVMDEVLKIITRTFNKAIEIKTALSSSLWTTEGDRSQIERVILNLCLNARDAMPDGGLLRIMTSNKEITDETRLYTWLKAGKYAVISMIDTGIGMDEENKKHIFDPFFTTKEKGTGLGLAMVYGIVKNHNGFITVDSEPGKGSNFTIYFPAVEKEVKIEKAKIVEAAKGEGTILVVDDEDFIRNLTREILERLGYNIIEASNGFEAIEIYTKKKDVIDLIILDMIMPRMGGDEAFRRLKIIDPDIRVLISSGYGIEEQTTEMTKDASVVGFIQKPFNVTRIAEAVKKALTSARLPHKDILQ